MIKKISIVIPIFNEKNNISALINEIKKTLNKKIVYEVIIVNDGSTDITKEFLSDINKKEKNITVINHKKNYGQSMALITGIRNSNFDHIVTLDGDGQNDPKDIIKLINNFDEKILFMMVIGNRINRNDSPARKIASRLAFRIRKIVLHDDTPDTGCAIKVFKKQDFLELPFFNHQHRFLPFLFKTFNGKVVSVPVNHRARKSGVSKYSNFQRLLVGISDIFGVIWLNKRITWPILLENNKKINISRRNKNGN